MQLETAEIMQRATPPVAVSAASIAGLPLSEWVYVLTAAYLVLQIAWFIAQRVKDYKEYRDGRE